MYRSTDGQTWTQATNQPSRSKALENITYGNGMFLILEGSENYHYSTNLTSWTKKAFNSPDLNVKVLAYGNGIFTMAGYYTSSNVKYTKTRYTTDCQTWTDGSGIPTSVMISDLIYDGTKFVCVGESGEIYVSTDGATWTNVTSPTTVQLNGIAFGNV